MKKRVLYEFEPADRLRRGATLEELQAFVEEISVATINRDPAGVPVWLHEGGLTVEINE